MNVNEKGNHGLIKVISDLYDQGYSCFTPFDDYNPIDLIVVNKDGVTRRIQIKYRSKMKSKDRYEVAARSVVNRKVVKINKNLIDGWAVYLADLDRVIYLPVSIMKTKNVHYIKPTDESGISNIFQLED